MSSLVTLLNNFSKWFYCFWNVLGIWPHFGSLRRTFFEIMFLSLLSFLLFLAYLFLCACTPNWRVSFLSATFTLAVCSGIPSRSMYTTRRVHTELQYKLYSAWMHSFPWKAFFALWYFHSSGHNIQPDLCECKTSSYRKKGRVWEGEERERNKKILV